jgi:hypothetical protein
MNGKTPKGLFDGIRARQFPSNTHGSMEFVEGKGLEPSRGGLGQSKVDICSVEGMTVGCSVECEAGSQGPDWKSSGSRA